MKMQRYGSFEEGMEEDDRDGPYVRLKDHEKLVNKLATALREMRDAATNLADFVVPIPVENSNLIYATYRAVKYATSVLNENGLEEATSCR